MTTATAAPPTVAEATPAKDTHNTGTGPKPVKAENAEMLAKAAPETDANIERRSGLIVKVRNAVAAVRGLVYDRAKLQAIVVGYLAELLSTKPTNKQLAEALNEPYDPSYHGPKPVTATVHSPESGLPIELEVSKQNPDPYRQQVRRYKILAHIEARIVPDKAEWELSKVKDGIIINDERFTSPVDALRSGKVSMEAVFQAYVNILQPKTLVLSKWSTSQVKEARKAAKTVKVTVRQYDKKMNREQKVRVEPHLSAHIFFGLVDGLIQAAVAADTFRLPKSNADTLVAGLSELSAPVNAPQAEPTPAA